jgi:hypothetical protein
MRPLQPITSAAPEAFYQCVCVFSIRECEACVNVNLTLPLLPFARRVCVCVNVNLTLPVLPLATRVCVCVNVNLTLPVLPFVRRVCACVNVNLTLPVLPLARQTSTICGTIQKGRRVCVRV